MTGTLGSDPADMRNATPSLILLNLALEDHAIITCLTLSFMQLLAEDGVGSK